ncbi:partial Anti-sigma F factor antagonist, partial [uncultured bacterium]
MTQLTMDWSPLAGMTRTALVKLAGAIDAETVYTFEEKMKERFDRDIMFFLFDMEGIKYCNCTGLGSLVATTDNLDKTGGQLAMFNLNPKVCVVFEMLGINAFFKIFKSKEDALASLKKLQSPLGFGSKVPTGALPETRTPKPARLELATCCAGALAQCALSGDLREGDLPM